MIFFAHLSKESCLIFLFAFCGVQLFGDRADTLPQMSTSDTYTVGTLQLGICKDRGLLILYKVSLANRWKKVNAVQNVLYFIIPYPAFFYLLQEIRRCLRA